MVQAFRLLGKLTGFRQHLMGDPARLVRRFGDAGDVGRNLLGAACGLLDIAGDLAGRGALLLDRRRDAAELSLTAEMVAVMSWMAVTACPVAPWTEAIWLAISSVALAVWLARFLTSDATMAKPLPASPARAASIVAFSASRLVWLAMSLIRLTTSPIFSAAIGQAGDDLGWSAPPRRRPHAAYPTTSATCRPISLIEAESSSAADATVWTLPDASSARCRRTAEDARVACSATADMLLAVAVISVAADGDMLHHRLDMGFEVGGEIQDLLLPQGLGLGLHSACSSRRRSTASPFSLKNSTAVAIWPISLVLAVKGTSTE